MTERMQFEVNSAVEPELRRLGGALAALKAAISATGAVKRGILYSSDLLEPLEGEPDEQLAIAISDWDCIDNTENGVVHRYPGIFEVSDEVVARCRDLNEAKTEFESLVRALEHAGATPYQMRLAYRAAGHPRIHPLQAWRQINILDGGLSSVGFTIAKQAQGVERLSCGETAKRLYERGANDIAEMVQSYGEQSEFCWHTPVSRHVRANLTWGGGDAVARRMIHASLPFLVSEGCWPSKRVRFNPPRDHSRRKDAANDVIAYLPFRKGAYLTHAK